jgi:hypothetical protein
MRKRYLSQVAEDGVVVSDSLFAPLVDKQTWFARNGYTSEGIAERVRGQLQQRGVKVLSSIESNRRMLAGQATHWLTVIPQVANDGEGQDSLTAYAVELELQQPLSYLIHAGEHPFLARISCDATSQRRLGAGLGNMKVQFDQDLSDLVDQFADSLSDAGSDR